MKKRTYLWIVSNLGSKTWRDKIFKDLYCMSLWVYSFPIVSSKWPVALPSVVVSRIISFVKFSLFSFPFSTRRCLARCQRHVITLRKYSLYFHELLFSGYLIYIFAFWKIGIIPSFTFMTIRLLMYFYKFWRFSDELNPLSSILLFRRRLMKHNEI